MLYPNFSELIKLQAASTGNILKNKYNQNSLTAGDYNSLFRGQGMEFDSVRPYIVGDDIRYIDWRVTARTHKPHIKTFQAECDRKIMLIVDSNSYMRFGTRGTFKSIQAARAVALLAGMGFKNRDRVGGLVFGDIAEGVKFFPPTRQRAAAWSLFKLLCEPNVISKQLITLEFALRQLKHISPGTLIFLITDLEAIIATNVQLFAEIKAKGDLILLPIVDPIDSNFPELSNVVCTNNAGLEVNINAVSAATRKKYAELWHAEQNQLKNILKKYKLKLITLKTNQAVHRDLNYGLQQLRNY